VKPTVLTRAWRVNLECDEGKCLQVGTHRLELLQIHGALGNALAPYGTFRSLSSESLATIRNTVPGMSATQPAEARRAPIRGLPGGSSLLHRPERRQRPTLVHSFGDLTLTGELVSPLFFRRKVHVIARDAAPSPLRSARRREHTLP
jgi:hypothetical protein